MNNELNKVLKETKSRFLSLSLPTNRQMGKVHSVFQTSFNVLVNDTLFNFSQQGMSLSAHGCILDRKTMNELLEVCKPGNLVKVDKGVFSFYTSNGVLRVDVSQMNEIDLSIPMVNMPRFAISHSALYTALKAVSFDEEIGLKREGKTEEAFATLRKVFQHPQEEHIKAIKYLIGRGKGLTPSGDDMLVGFTMIRKAFIGVDAFEKTLEESVATRSTTDISRAYYKSFFAGYVSSLFISLIESTESKEQADVFKLIERIGRYGHTSGYDTLFGVYMGLQSLINETEE